jgi:hypothetical protein
MFMTKGGNDSFYVNTVDMMLRKRCPIKIAKEAR